jgi:CubicO group peptidase (beta-lactamase class C family)
VAIVEGGEVTFARAYGAANLTHDVPFTLETLTNIGSTAKQFTAFGILLLVDEGRLSLDDDVRDVLPQLPDLGSTVTLRHLLTHTSGYREFVNALAIGGWSLENADHISRREIIRVVQGQPALQNVPGGEFNYNNTGYGLLAMVIEEVSGESFPEWMADHVFEPLGMGVTTVRSHPFELVTNSAQGYLPEGPGGGFREAADLGAAMGAGGVYATVGDLASWMAHLASPGVGERHLVEQMTTPALLNSGVPIPYGLGMMLDEERGLRRVHHPGGDTAHRSHFAYYPELDAGVIVLSNHGGFGGDIPARITEAFFGEHMEAGAPAVATPDPSLFDPATLDASVLDSFAGRYELVIQPGFILEIRREGEALVGQATGQPPFPLVATSDSTFALTVVEAGITFHRDAQGSATALTLHQGGDNLAVRLPDAELDELELEPFEGRYYSSEFETVYTARVDEGTLVLEHRRLGAMRLSHSSADSFSGPFPLMQVVFERDDTSAVTGFLASNGRARGVPFTRAGDGGTLPP